MMPSAASADNVLEFFESLNKRQWDRMEKVLWEDAQLLFPKTQPLNGRDKILKFFHVLFRQYPELTFHIERTIVEGNLAAAHWTNRGVTRKNAVYENEGVTLLEYRDGKISHISDFFKDTEKF